MSLENFLNTLETYITPSHPNYYLADYNDDDVKKLIRIVREMKRNIDVCKLTECLKRCDELTDE